MLRGNHSARIDDKGRSRSRAVRSLIEEKYGTQVFVTSTDGNRSRLPLPSAGDRDAPGRDAEHAPAAAVPRPRQLLRPGRRLDGRRVLIHRAADSAAISGDVDVLGVLTYSTSEHERFAARIRTTPHRRRLNACPRRDLSDARSRAGHVARSWRARPRARRAVRGLHGRPRRPRARAARRRRHASCGIDRDPEALVRAARPGALVRRSNW